MGLNIELGFRLNLSCVGWLRITYGTRPGLIPHPSSIPSQHFPWALFSHKTRRIQHWMATILSYSCCDLGMCQYSLPNAVVGFKTKADSCVRLAVTTSQFASEPEVLCNSECTQRPKSNSVSTANQWFHSLELRPARVNSKLLLARQRNRRSRIDEPWAPKFEKQCQGRGLKSANVQAWQHEPKSGQS